MRRLALVTAAAAMVAITCGTPTATAAPPTTVIQFVPQWMTLATPASWTEPERRITAEFQQFGLRPAGENQLPPGCNGCGVEPATAILTAYAPGRFNPAIARTGEPVTVNADSDGFLRVAKDSGEAVLAWPYANGAWATLRARTDLTRNRDVMLELARALHPDEVTPIRLPLSMPGVPATMPLSEIYVDNRGYGTTLHFISCPRNDIGRTGDCFGEVDKMNVQIWPTDGYSGHITQRDSTPAKIGGRDGIYESTGRRAAVQVQPGMLVVAELQGPSGQPGQSLPNPGSNLKDILATLTWASDPGNPQTWASVADWVR